MPRQQRTRKQKGGGKKLYHSVDQITEKEIKDIFCGGREFGEMPTAENPLFIIKWGPPGSGKSSEKIMKEIRKLGVPLEDYVDFTPDKIIEALLPFRFESSRAKIRNIRIHTDLEIADFAHARLMLQSAKKNTVKSKNIDELLAQWSSLAPTRAVREKIDSLRKNIVYNSVSRSYKKWRADTRNTGGKTIKEKMNDFLLECLHQGKHIQYETMGSGYGQGDEKVLLKSEFTGKRATSGRLLGQIDIFKNTWEEMLGKIVYDEEGTPLRAEKTGDFYIPENYQIVIIYPILPRAEIIKRASIRATKQLFESDYFSIEDGATYAWWLQKFGQELSAILFQNVVQDKAKKAKFLTELPKTIQKVAKESQEIDGDAFISYISNLKNQIKDGAPSTITFPMYRAIAPEKIMDVAEEAFQYSVDYFLKQYILLGRIQSVIYVSNI